MANLIYSGASGTARSQTNIEKILVRYNLNTPMQFLAGGTVSMEEVIDSGERLSISFQNGSNGVEEIASSYQLLVLAHIEGLRNQNMVYINTIASEIPGMILVNYVEFVIPIFHGCRSFVAGDILSIEIKATYGTLTLHGIDNPYQSQAAKPYVYRMVTVLGSNTSVVASDAKIIYVKNDDNFQLQIMGNSQVQWGNKDFLAQLADDFVSNLTPYQKSSYIGIDITQFGNAQILAKFDNVDYFYYKQQ